MQRSAIAVCVVLALCVAAQAQLCGPPYGSVNFTFVAEGVAETGFLSIDLTQMAMAANVTGYTAQGQFFAGNFIYVNGTGYFIENGTCGQTTADNVPAALLHKCLPAGGFYTQSMIGGNQATTYTIITESNVTAVTVVEFSPYNFPVSHSFMNFTESGTQEGAFTLLYSNPSATTNNNYFVLPDICNQAQPVKEVHPMVHRAMNHLRFV
jgi:hypothetical protein